MVFPLIAGITAVAAALSSAELRNVFEAESEVSENGRSEEEGKDWRLVMLGDRVEHFRKILNKTPSQFVEEAKISRTALRNLELGCDTKISTLLAVSEALSVPLTVLLQGLQPEVEERLVKKLDANLEEKNLKAKPEAKVTQEGEWFELETPDGQRVRLRAVRTE